MDEKRFLRDLNNRFEKIEKTISHNSQLMNEQMKKISTSKFTTRNGAAKENFERGLAYANVIIIAGYAGMFTIWSFTREFLTQNAALWSATLLGASIIVFVIWEVFRMAIHSIESYNEIINKQISIFSLKTIFCLWIFVFAFTVLSGFGAAFLLIYNFAALLAGWSPWPK